MSDFSRVSPTDIREAAFGFTIPDGSGVDDTLAKLIDKAEQRVLSRLPNIQARIDAGLTTRGALAGVVEDMVLRVVRNPDGKKSETIDDYSWTLDPQVSSGMLYLSDEEMLLLVPPVPSTRRRVGTIRLGVPAWRMPR